MASNNGLNVVLICVDQWRGDCLGIAGHPVVHTPYLDQLALNGVRLRCAYSSVPSCIAARAAIYTGQSQRSHGRVGYQDGVPWNYPITLASEFTRQGYQTQAIGKMHVFPERSQLGFQNVVLHDGYLHFARHHAVDPERIDDYLPWLRLQLGRDADYFDHGVNCNSYVARPWDKPEFVHPTDFVVTQAIDFLRRRDLRKPFFLYLSFHRPHPPYDPPEWAFNQYVDEPMAAVPIGDWTAQLEEHADPHRPDTQVGSIPHRILQRARAGYYGHMTHIDHQINRFLETLAEYGLREKTITCFVSDHGELMGDHNLFRKALPYEGAARIPFILQGPPEIGFRQGHVIDAVAELRDVMPTLLDGAGLPIPDSVEGQSVIPLAQGRRVPWRDYIHGEHPALGQAVHWITDGREKYIWFSDSGREQLFDLVEDPTECQDLGRQPGSEPRLAHWRHILIGELQGREEGYSDGERLITKRPVQSILSHISGFRSGTNARTPWNAQTSRTRESKAFDRG